MIKEVKNLTNIKLTESEDGIWLHFEAKGLKASVNLSLSGLYSGDITNRAIGAWAREQLDRQPCMVQGEHVILDPLSPAPNNEFLKEGQEERTDASRSRPVEGGY